jgi:hypothetical protein
MANLPAQVPNGVLRSDERSDHAQNDLEYEALVTECNYLATPAFG